MLNANSLRVGYVLKMYPRFSETFIVNEILAHEAAGLSIEIFSLRYPVDGRFHETLARIRASLTYIKPKSPSARELWRLIGELGRDQPLIWPILSQAQGEGVGDVYQALQLAREVRQREITNLHAHFGSVAARVSRLASKIAGVPYTFTMHAKDIYHQDVDGDATRRNLADAAAVITISDFNRRHLLENYGPAASHVQRVYNGLDLGHFPFRPPAGRPPQIVAVGRLVEKKGFTYLIESCAYLKERGRRFRCSIIGAGPLESELQDQIVRLDLRDQVALLGPKPQGEVIKHLSEAAIFAAPCVIGSDGNRDGLPTVLIEAMALGTPCITTDVTGIPELVRHKATGLMVPQRDSRALSAALDLLLDDEPLRLRLAGNARGLVEESFDSARTSRAIRDIFRKATSAPLAVPPELERV